MQRCIIIEPHESGAWFSCPQTTTFTLLLINLPLRLGVAEDVWAFSLWDFLVWCAALTQNPFKMDYFSYSMSCNSLFSTVMAKSLDIISVYQKTILVILWGNTSDVLLLLPHYGGTLYPQLSKSTLQWTIFNAPLKQFFSINLFRTPMDDIWLRFVLFVALERPGEPQRNNAVDIFYDSAFSTCLLQHHKNAWSVQSSINQ